MDWTNIVGSGGIALFAAVVGFVLAVGLAQRSEKLHRRGLITALLGELTTNAIAILTIHEHGETTAYSTAIWKDAKLELAAELTTDQFRGLLQVYGSGLVELAFMAVKARTPNAKKLLEGNYEDIRKLHASILGDQRFSEITRPWNELPSFKQAMLRWR